MGDPYERRSLAALRPRGSPLPIFRLQPSGGGREGERRGRSPLPHPLLPKHGRALENPDGAPATAATFRDILNVYRPFHWQFEFPEVFFNDDGSENPEGGFDAVVGNPPWERVNLEELQFFGSRDPRIAKASTGAKRKALIHDLKVGNPGLLREFNLAKDATDRTVAFVQRSGFFPELSGGRVNLYPLFVERGMGLLNPKGRLGLLVPSGIASDKTCAPFFGVLTARGQLITLADFENVGYEEEGKRVQFFPDVDSRFKFSIFLASRTGEAGREARVGFYLRDPQELYNPERLFPMSTEEFWRFNPNTGTAPSVRSRRDCDLLGKLYDRAPGFWMRANALRKTPESNPWGVRFM
ncbi:MAG: hypothetical protein C4320_08960, partial [Armatimonadota bacterium]